MKNVIRKITSAIATCEKELDEDIFDTDALERLYYATGPAKI